MSSPDRDHAAGNTNDATDQEPPESTGRLRHSLSGVSQNLLLCLLARHLESSAPRPALEDPWASALVQRLNLDAQRFDATRKLRAATTIRTTLVDEITRDYVQRVETATIVTFGAGLCTRYFRINAPDSYWLDIDLPNVAALRQELLPAHDNREVIASSVLDPRWGGSLRDRRAERILFIAEGLFMFLDPDEVRALLTRIADRYAGADMVAESVDPHSLTRAGGHHPLLPAGAELRWATHDFTDVAQWHRRIDVVDQWAFADRDPRLPQRHGLRERLTGTGPKIRLGHLRIASDR